MSTRIPIAQGASRCSDCSLGQICLPVGLAAEDVRRMDDLVQERIRLKKGQGLYAQGDALDAVYGIRFGTLKTQVTTADGHQHITGFHLPGEIVGFDAIGDMCHPSDATALEDSEVCVVHLDGLQSLARALPSLQRQFLRLMSKEISQDQQMLLALAAMRADERLAAFLLNLSQRLAARGYSPSEFLLRMSREEIGSHLGLKLETVSRLFSRFAQAGLIQIKQREVRLLDIEGLRDVVGSPC